MLVFVVFTLALAYWLYKFSVFWAHRSHMKRLSAKFPGPKGQPIIGNLYQLSRSPEKFPVEVVQRANFFAAQGHDVINIWNLQHCMFSPLNGRGLKAILDSNEEINKGQFYDIVHPWLGSGLLLSKADKWRPRRRLLTPTFHFSMLDDYIYTMNQHAKVLTEDILSDQNGKLIDFAPLIKRCTLDIICETAMGKLLDSQHNTNHPYVMAVQSIIGITIQIITKPQNWITAYRRLTGLQQQFDENVAIAHNFTRTVIEERIESLRQGEVEKNKRAFLDLLIEQMEKETLTVEDLREEVETFMFAGHDTTATGLAWAMWCFACHPDAQQKAFEELQGIFGDDMNRDITRDDLNKMSYLERCIKESLRLYPPVPMVHRTLKNDLPSGEYVFPKGSTVSINPLIVHLNEQTYPNAKMYDPDRFLPEKIAERHAYDFIPFSAGPRNCIGQKFALYEEKLVLSWLLRRFRFVSNRQREDNLRMGELIMRPKLGCPVEVHRR